jgi:threonine/homoserine/homoserine lactone efflux protein
MLQLFITGFMAAFIGSAVPGVLNMSAAKFAIQYNKQKALLFAIGASVIVTIYCLLSLFCAQYISISKTLLQNLYKAGSIVFFILFFYFLIKGRKDRKQPTNQIDTDRHNFLLTGVLLSFVNILPLPYYIIIAVILQHENSYHFNTVDVTTFVSSVFIGSIAIFAAYILLFTSKYSKKLQNLLTYSNTIISILSAGIMFFSIFKVLTI